jgi:hypothetical protein
VLKCYAGSDLETEITWYWAIPGAKALPVPTVFFDRTWFFKEDAPAVVGEQLPRPPYYRGQAPVDVGGQHYCGDEDAWLGLASPADALVDRDPNNGLPRCCGRWPVQVKGGCAIGGELEQWTFAAAGGAAVGGLVEEVLITDGVAVGGLVEEVLITDGVGVGGLVEVVSDPPLCSGQFSVQCVVFRSVGTCIPPGIHDVFFEWTGEVYQCVTDLPLSAGGNALNWQLRPDLVNGWYRWFDGGTEIDPQNWNCDEFTFWESSNTAGCAGSSLITLDQVTPF